MKPIATSTTEDGKRRILWYVDEDYTPFGSFALDTEAETQDAEEWEAERLRDGRLCAYGGVVQVAVDCPCLECDNWHETDACWGIVYEPGDFEAMARDVFGVEIHETTES